MILLGAGERVFFVHGFAKSDRDNIRDDELAALKRLAGEAITAGVLTEVTGDEQGQAIP